MRPTIEVDQQMLDDVRGRLGDFEKKAPQVISAAMNRALSNVVTNVSKETRQRYNIKAADIKETLSKTRATKTNIEAIVRSRGNLIPLDRFKVSPKKPSPKRKAPLKAAVKKDGGMKAVTGAFVADISGNKVFRREGRRRLPIQRLFGPSVPQMLKNEAIQQRINDEGRATFYRRLDQEIDWILKKGAKS